MIYCFAVEFSEINGIIKRKGGKLYLFWLRSGNNNNPNNSQFLSSSGGWWNAYTAASLAVRPALHSFTKDKVNFPAFNADVVLNRR